jgi:hypothetical protein
MKKSTVSNIRKKRIGRPAVNAVPVLVRIPPAEIEPIDAWIAKQKPSPSRPEAIRRLVEIGLGSVKVARAQKRSDSPTARDLAAAQIDRLTDPAAPADEQAHRKRRLLKGPEEFREARVDRVKKK